MCVVALLLSVTCWWWGAVVARRQDPDRYAGRGVRKAADSVRTLLLDKLIVLDVLSNQEAIDAALKSEANAPANAVLACSIACGEHPSRARSRAPNRTAHPIRTAPGNSL